MTRKIVRIGSSLAITLPKDIVERLGLKKGDQVEVSVHPLNGAITLRPPARYFDSGKVTKRFRERSRDLLIRRGRLYRRLAK